jgi:S1-C subfamily serine protease
MATIGYKFYIAYQGPTSSLAVVARVLIAFLCCATPFLLARPVRGAVRQLQSARADFADTVRAVRASVVRIECSEHPKETPFNVGTGFFAGNDGSVITVRHLIDACAKYVGSSVLAHHNEEGFLRVGVPFPVVESSNLSVDPQFDVYDADVVDEDPAHDLALIRPARNLISSNSSAVALPREPLRTAVALFSQRPDEGLSVATSGYPFGSDALITTFGYIASSWESSGAFGLIVPEPQDADLYLGDFTVNAGNSGGPVYSTSDARVVGICEGYRDASVFLGSKSPTDLTYNSGLSVIIPAKYIDELLTRNNVKNDS